MDAIAGILKNELHKLLVDGIKYEKIPTTDDGSEWEMTQFKNDELIDYFGSLPVKTSVYDYVAYDSEESVDLQLR